MDFTPIPYEALLHRRALSITVLIPNRIANQNSMCSAVINREHRIGKLAANASTIARARCLTGTTARPSIAYLSLLPFGNIERVVYRTRIVGVREVAFVERVQEHLHRP